MESPQLAVVVETWALLLFCQSAQVANQLVTCSPSELTKPMGDTAVFTCKFTSMTVLEYQLYLYREYNESKTQKITTWNEKQDSGKYSIVRVDSHTFEVKILNLEEEDTGKYYCGLISISSSSRTVVESNRFNLTVTEKARTTAEPTTQEAEEEKEGDRGWNAKELPLAFIGGTGLILGLAFLVFLLFKAVRRKTEEETRPAEDAPLEGLPPVANAFTVDYGILEFPAKAPPKRPPVEKTEYATIVFPTCEKSPKRQNYLDRTQLP